ncbi:MAG: alpha/beta hydrolase [Myxococcota bacterium]|nr:alpha/beta hydrolase [Myxococcota bacterium]
MEAVDPPLLWLTHDSRSSAYTDQGSGRPIVTISGYPGSPRDFRYLGPRLTPHARVIRSALPGQGQTPAESGGTTLDARAAYIEGLLEALELEDVVLVGHSMGGGIAQAVAARSERVTALALLASVGIRRHQGMRWTHPATLPLVRSDRAWVFTEPLIYRAYRALGFPRSIDRGAMRNGLISALQLDFDALGALPEQVRCPTLVAWTEDDALVEPAISRELADKLPDGPRLAFPTGGHALQKTRAEEIAEGIRALMA